VPYSTNGQARTWTYTWDATGLLLSINGPLNGAGDTTTYTWTSGLLTRVTNALGQATQITAHDPHGLPQTVVDPNGAVTDMAYDARGRLTSVIRRAASGDATTSFTYDAAGLLTRMTLPDGSYLDYSYDAAHRLTAVQNNLGERIEYSLDLMGNRTAETIKTAAGGAITKTMTRAYDQLGRLLQSIGAASQTTAYAYDHEGNVVSLTDPLNGLTTQAYDALDRLIQSTDATRTGLTDYGYDTRDNLTEVTDPRGIATSYVYNGFGEAIQAASPDAGTTVYRYDAAGRLTEATDGRNVTTQYSYDNLNRVTAKSFPRSRGENVTYTYDDPTAGNFGIGRLTRIVDESGTTGFAYDARGNLARRSWTPAGTTLAYTTAYAYDLADRPTQVVYPSGRIVDYGRDSLGRVASATTRANGAATPVTLASGLAYKPFGPLSGAGFGNGLSAALDYDQDYRLTSLVSGDADSFVQNLAYGYDNADDILAVTDAIAAGRSQTFQYDPLFRLTQAAGAYGTVTYGYDAVGNRTSLIQASATDTYVYDAFSNRLASVTSGGIIRQFTYDGAGNTTADSGGGVNLAFAYNDANRMKQATAAGATTLYTYNALGQRAIKSPSGKNVPAAQKRHFHYDQDGKLLAESDGAGALIREYVWLEGLPLATVEAGALRYVHADHLGTPQKMTDAAQSIAWDGQFEPFGEEFLITGLATMPLRFPGQYADEESGLSYNYFRDYDPTLGRYIESDPIGLLGGLNSYSYVSANPTRLLDRYGLDAIVTVSGNRVHITIPIQYSGPGVRPEMVRIWNDAIERIWSGQFGKYGVETDVVEGGMNRICVDKRLNIRAHVDPKHLYLVGGNTGSWSYAASGGTAAHEAGHLLYLGERYTGFRTPNPGYEKHIMANTYGTQVFESDIEAIIDHFTRYPTDSTPGAEAPTPLCDCKPMLE